MDNERLCVREPAEKNLFTNIILGLIRARKNPVKTSLFLATSYSTSFSLLCVLLKCLRCSLCVSGSNISFSLPLSLSSFLLYSLSLSISEVFICTSLSVSVKTLCDLGAVGFYILSCFYHIFVVSIVLNKTK